MKYLGVVLVLCFFAALKAEMVEEVDTQFFGKAKKYTDASGLFLKKLGKSIKGEKCRKCRVVHGRHSWITDNWNKFKNMKLSQMLFASSHDAGCTNLNKGPSGDLDLMANLPKQLKFLKGANPLKLTKFANMVGATQFKSIYEQLQMGIRHIDIRFCLYKNKSWRICHGAFGPTLERIMDDIKRWVEDPKNSKEVLFVAVRNFDAKLSGKWNEYSKKLGKKFADIVESKIGKHLNENWTMKDTLQTIVSSGKRLLYLGKNVPQSTGKQYSKSYGIIQDIWPNKDDVNAIKSVLKKKHDTHLKSQFGTALTGIQWLVTMQPDKKNSQMHFGSLNTLRAFQRTIKDQLKSFVKKDLNDCQYCNLIMVDVVEENYAIELSIQISKKRATALGF